MQNRSFRAFEFKSGLLFDHNDGVYHTRLHGLVGNETMDFSPGSTYFIYQYDGNSWINSTYPLLPGYFAACTHKEGFIFGNDTCKAIVIESVKADAPFLMGGPIESKGRLKYIDGCTDSLLISPWTYGQPCLNHLHFPAGIDQTPHTHPTIRIGLIARGNGECVTPFGNVTLTEGMLFAIMPHELVDPKIPESTPEHVYPFAEAVGLDGNNYPIGTHSFKTYHNNMDVIAFHPDSDYGPMDENHPMINRTIVNGQSAKNIDEIRTK